MSSGFEAYKDEKVVLTRLAQMCKLLLDLCQRADRDQQLGWKVYGCIRYTAAFKDLSRFDVDATDPQRLIEGLRRAAKRDPGEDSRTAVRFLLEELEHEPHRAGMNLADLISLLYLAHGPMSDQATVIEATATTSPNGLGGDKYSSALPGADNDK